MYIRPGRPRAAPRAGAPAPRRPQRPMTAGPPLAEDFSKRHKVYHELFKLLCATANSSYNYVYTSCVNCGL